MKNNSIHLAAAAVVATILGGFASAEELPQVKARQQLAVTQGFSQSSLAVLERASSLTQNEISAALVGTIRPSSAHQSTFAGDTLRTEGEGWWLEVSSDGSAAEYADLAVQANAHSFGRPLSEQMTAAELEQRGRAFIAAHLASQIVLGPEEDLVVLRADYRTEGGQDLATGTITRAVVANRVVFGRTIHGVPVVGNGSQVIVTFTNDGAVESFRYDWPAYRAVDRQSVVAPAEILTRVQTVMGVHTGVAAATSRMAVPARGKEYPLALTPNTQLQALDCGYYDAGFSARMAQSVQPGCTYLTVSQDAAGMRQGFSGAVPAGASFQPDAAWLETQLLSRK